MPKISVAAPKHALQAYLAAPAGAGPWPGVIVLHDVFGETADSRRHADWFAANGYLAAAPDLYSWGNKIRCVRSTLRDVFAGRGTAFDDIDAVRAMLAARADCTGKLGVIGFCMGGGFALLLAARHGFAASSVNYGRVPKDAAALLAGACPVVGSFGGRDRGLKGAAARLDSALAQNGVPRDVKEYPEAGHSFMNDHDGVPGWIAARMGLGFNLAATADAQARILAFFGEHLAASAAPGSV